MIILPCIHEIIAKTKQKMRHCASEGQNFEISQLYHNIHNLFTNITNTKRLERKSNEM